MRSLLAVLVLVLAAAPADAQFRRSQPFAEKGDFAVLAEVSGLDVLQLRPAVGGVGIRYRVADQTAVGLSVGVNGFSASAGSDDRDQNVSGTDVRVSTWFEQHVGRRSRTVSPFVGAGVRFNAGRNTSSDGLGPNAFESEVSQFGVGGALLLGAEVRLARGVTLGGAYTLGVEYQRNEQSFTAPGTDPGSQVQDVVRFGTGVTNLAVSAYF